MQKVLKFLERNVQWFALGLGVLYLLWTIYAYMLTPPVSVKVGTTELYPENVDEKIAETKGRDIDVAMKKTDTITLPVTDVLSPYLAKLDEKDSELPPMVVIQWSGTRGEVIGGGGIQGFVGSQVAQLPALPAAKFVAESHDITSIQPGGAAQPGGNAAVQPVMAREDVRWVSLKYKVPMSAVRDEFTKSFQNVSIARLFVSRFLQIELVREEKIGEDKWSEPTVVKSVTAAGQPDFPNDVMDPQDPTGRNVAFQYKDAVGKLDNELTSPPFPAPAAGAPAWYAPGQSPPTRAAKGPVRAGAPAPVRPVAPAPQAVAPPAGGGQNAQVGAGEFDVTSPNLADRDILVHDITARDGKTYRYAIRYKLANPVWDTLNIASAAFSRQFALVSPLSDWSKEIEIPLHTRLFVMNVNKPTSKVSFALFEWKDTGYQRKDQDAYPGDTVKDHADNVVGTVVDIRGDKDNTVLLIDSAGKLDKHSKRSDADDYQRLKDEVQPAVATVGAAIVK